MKWRTHSAAGVLMTYKFSSIFNTGTTDETVSSTPSGVGFNLFNVKKKKMVYWHVTLFWIYFFLKAQVSDDTQGQVKPRSITLKLLKICGSCHQHSAEVFLSAGPSSLKTAQLKFEITKEKPKWRTPGDRQQGCKMQSGATWSCCPRPRPRRAVQQENLKKHLDNVFKNAHLALCFYVNMKKEFWLH